MMNIFVMNKIQTHCPVTMTLRKLQNVIMIHLMMDYMGIYLLLMVNVAYFIIKEPLISTLLFMRKIVDVLCRMSCELIKVHLLETKSLHVYNHKFCFKVFITFFCSVIED